MISLDQVLLLQKKVETAVERISALGAENARLKADNDALRSKCAELSKALTDKVELVSTLEAEQSQIEEGILNALSRLDTVENSVLTASGTAVDGMPAEQSPAPTESQGEPEQSGFTQEPQNAEGQVPTEPTEESQPDSASAQNGEINGQFDIF